MSPQELLDQATGIRLVRKKPLLVERVEVRRENVSLILEWILSYNGEAFLSIDTTLHIKEPAGWTRVPYGSYIIHGAVNEFYLITHEMYVNYYEDVPQLG
jgi:hypothetical protein